MAFSFSVQCELQLVICLFLCLAFSDVLSFLVSLNISLMTAVGRRRRERIEVIVVMNEKSLYKCIYVLHDNKGGIII